MQIIRTNAMQEHYLGRLPGRNSVLRNPGKRNCIKIQTTTTMLKPPVSVRLVGAEKKEFRNKKNAWFSAFSKIWLLTSDLKIVVIEKKMHFEFLRYENKENMFYWM